MFFARICAMLCLAASPAMAESSRFFGHEVLVANLNGERALLVDGKALATADSIFVEKSASVAGVDLVVASLLTGGASCAPQTTLIAFAKDKPPQIVAPTDTDCREAELDIGKDSIRFTIAPTPARRGMNWTWTPAAGLSATENVAFQPDLQKSWANLRSAKIENAASLFGFADIGGQLHDLIGKDSEAIDLIDGNGYGKWKGDFYVASSCMPHRCDEAGALVVADHANRRVYLAWKPLDKKIVVRPAVSDWPRQARLQLKTWARPWMDETDSQNGIALVSARVSGGETPSVVGPHFDALRGIYKGEQGDALTHNGSWVWVFPRAGLIVYSKPKPSIADVVRAGDVLMRGEITRGNVRGTAFVYKNGCAPEPYPVSGDGYDRAPDARLVLRGAAPVRERQSCAVLGTSTTSANATLVFMGQGEFGDW